MSERIQRGRCKVCLDPFTADGTCRNRCDPALASPRRRAGRLNEKLRKQERTSTRIGISPNEMSAAVERAEPGYAAERSRLAAAFGRFTVHPKKRGSR